MHQHGITASSRNTGLLDGRPYLAPEWTGSFYVQRIGWTVVLHAYRLQGPNGTMFTLPVGFRMLSMGTVFFTWSNGSRCSTQGFNGIFLSTPSTSLTIGTVAYETFTFKTNDPWPTGLAAPTVLPVFT